MLRAVMAGLTGTAHGLIASQRVTQRAQMLRKWCAALESVRTNCACLRLPPEEIWQLSAVETGLHLTMEAAEGEMYTLTKEEKRWLLSCFQILLDGTQEQQIRQLEHVCGFFERRLLLAEEKQRRDAKLYAALGVFGGLILFLVCL